MTPWLGNSLRRRVTVMAGLTTALALIGAGVAIHLLARTIVYRGFDADLLARARALAALVKIEPNPTNLGNPHPDVDLVAAGAVVDLDMEFQLWTGDGTLLAGDQDLGPWTIVNHTAGPVVGIPRWESRTLHGNRPARALVIRLRARPQPGGRSLDAPVMQLVRPIDDLEDQLFGLDVLLMSVLVVITVFSAAILTWIISRELRPLTSLATEIANLDRGNLHRPLATGGLRKELAPVVSHLNALLARIEEAMVRERRFSAAAAHELRTPLAGLRATLEVALMDPGRTAGESTRANLCLDMVLDMQHLVDALLMLARLEAGQVVPAFQRVRLAELLAEVWGDLAARASAKRMRHTVDIADDLEIPTDPHLMRLVLGNLLGNAVDHGDAEGDIAVQVFRDNAIICLVISNSGSRVAQADAPRVVERFWRGDSSRNAQGHHCGLGLSLAQDALRVIGGSMIVHTVPGERFSVTIHLSG